MTDDQPSSSEQHDTAIALHSVPDDELRSLRDAFPLPAVDADHPRHASTRGIHAECAKRKLV